MRHWLSVVAVVAQGMGVSVVPSPMQRSGLRGAVFRPIEGAALQSNVYCTWRAGSDHPARDRFLKTLAAPAA